MADAHLVTWSGPAGEIRWGYRRAATVAHWTWTTGGDLVATVTDRDTFAVQQAPLTFVVTRPAGAWRWPVITLEISGATLYARLGPQEET